MESLLSSPAIHGVVPVLIVALVAAIILKFAKGCIKFLIVAVIIAILIIYVIPTFIL